jgi:chloramphenicol 3-O phosphotransferase
VTAIVGGKGRIVLLNGVGSVGKSSIAKALQELASAPFLHVEMDAFLNMMPERSIGQAEGLVFETIEADGKPSVVITSGPVAERTFRGMRHAVAAMAAQGNDLIVDDVMLGDAGADYAAVLAGFEVFRVGVFASLEVLEERERRRGDRMIGLARWQYDRVHQGMTYDLEVDAGVMTALDCAKLIKEKFGL